MSAERTRTRRTIRPSDFLAPAYVVTCLLFGGATREALPLHLALSFVGLGILGWLWIAGPAVTLSRAAQALRAIVLLAFAIALLQLVPLPPAIWTSLPGRAPIAAGFGLLGAPLPWLPLSLAPELTLRAIAAVLPAVAVAGLVLTGTRRSVQFSLGAVVLVALGSVLFGLVQMSSGLYFYERTNRGQPTGFFANSNHLATLLLVAIPIVAMVVARAGSREHGHQRLAALRVLMAGLVGVLLLGLLTNGSRAGLVLALPVVAASVWLLWLGRGGTMRPAMVRWACLGAAAVAAVLVAAAMSSLMAIPGEDVRITSRPKIFATAGQALLAYAPVGSGFGTFPLVYPGFEPSDEVRDVFVNHAHNDYAELLVEGGIGALAVMLLLIGWWGRRTVNLWSTIETGTLMGRAGSIGAAAILLHSIVDYPARTIAIMILLALCLALMARPTLRTDTRGGDVVPVKARHRSFEDE